MKIKHLLVLCLLVLADLSVSNVLAASNPVIQVRDAYVRGLPSSAVNTSAYMTLVNRGDSDIILTGASSPAAESVTLHNTVRRNGQMSMEHVMSATIAVGDRLELESGGMHLMLMGLKSSLRDGDSVRLSLHFEGGFVQTITLPVISVLNE